MQDGCTPLDKSPASRESDAATTAPPSSGATAQRLTKARRHLNRILRVRRTVDRLFLYHLSPDMAAPCAEPWQMRAWNPRPGRPAAQLEHGSRGVRRGRASDGGCEKSNGVHVLQSFLETRVGAAGALLCGCGSPQTRRRRCVRYAGLSEGRPTVLTECRASLSNQACFFPTLPRPLAQ